MTDHGVTEDGMSPNRKKVGVDLGLTDEEKQELRRIAQVVIDKKSRGEELPTFSPLTEKLTEHLGAFVTIQKKGMLRGCIGSVQANDELYKTVEYMAEAAACRDPRFRPVGEEELPFLDLEISVLTPLVEIDDPNEVEVGRHGILIRKGACSGLLLPQVATERSWDRITFLEQTCRKAGLPENAWKDKEAKIYVFSADVF
jgi:AmmeMemoRadiSam system protein A